jgi:hypothetical protein
MASKSGGGSTSRNNVRPASRLGSPARGVNPGHVAQYGSALGNRAMEKQTNYRGEPKFTQSPAGGAVKLGNEVAKNVGGGGPGSGRSVMKSGSQHGLAPPAPIGPTRDTLAEFGNDSPNVRGRR